VTVLRALFVLLATAALGLGIAVAVESGPAAASASASVVADATVRSSSPTTNYGTAQQNTVDGRPAAVAYYRFTVAVPAGEVVTRAVFRCWAGSSNAGGGVVRPVTNAWDERTVTWADAPAAATPPTASTGPVTAHSWARADVTAAVRSAGTYSFTMSTASPTAWSCASRENVGSHPPALDVTTAPAGSGSTAPSTAPATAPTTPATAPATTAPGTSAPPSSPAASTSSAPSTRPVTSTPAPSTTAPSTSPSAPSGSHASMSLPARGTFFYPWFGEAWNQSGYNPATHYRPSAGYYATTSMLSSQVQSMIYGGFDFAASSWWGRGSKEDARFAPLLSAAHGTSLRIAPYYEAEGNAISGVAGSPNPTSAQITADLDYLAAHYVADPNYLWIGGKPAIFVYGDGSDSCATAARWATANAAASTHFYVVLKVVSGYQNCAAQPGNWHQYGPATATDSQGTHSYTISPGFYKFSESAPRLARDTARWAQDVQAMNCSPAAFRLVTTFNEWGEGTSVESATQWATSSGQGSYLDVLHDHRTC
jgi:hypothetical protein